MNEQIINILREWGYPEWMFDNLISKLQKLSPKIRKHFDKWIIDRGEPNIDVEGYSFSSLIKDYEMTPINAFITLNWLALNPDEAKLALQEVLDEIRK